METMQEMMQLRDNIESTMDNTKIEVQARQLDHEIRAVVLDARKSFVKLGQLIAKMRERQLWTHLLDREGKQKYRSLEDYVMSAVGPMARGKYFQIIAAHSLTEGENAIPATTVERMGPVKAAEVARLEPKDRTPDIIEAATKEPVGVVRNKVQAKLNESLPLEETREPTRLVSINLAESVANAFEDLIELMTFMAGIRDSDNSQTMRTKAVGAMIIATQNYFSEELAVAEKYKAAQEGINECNSAQPFADGKEEAQLIDREDVPPPSRKRSPAPCTDDATKTPYGSTFNLPARNRGEGKEVQVDTG
jgi:hypothetical protein